MNRSAAGTPDFSSLSLDRRWLAELLRRATTPLPLLFGAIAGAMLIGAAGALGSLWIGIAIAVLVAPGFIAMAAVRPAWVLAAVLALSPFDPLFFGELLKIGAGREVLGMLRFWKEFGILALGVAALVRGARALDLLDVIALAFLALLVGYLAVPFGPTPDVRLVAARQDGFLILIFVVVRHLRFRSPDRRLLAVALLIEGAITLATGLWNVFDPTSWSRFLASSGVLAYQAQQPGGSPYVPLVYSVVGNRLLLHASGLFFSSLSFGFFMLVPLGIACSRAGVASGRLLRAATILVGAGGTMLSLTRTAILAMFGMFLATIALSSRRVAAVTSGLFIALALVPLASAIGLTDRLATTLASSDASSNIHISRLGSDAAGLLAAPIGHGLGTAASTGARFSVAGAAIQESWYFQIGSEMGILAFALVLLLVVGCLVRTAKGAVAGDAWSQAGFLVLAATASCAIFLHTYDAIGVAWPVWAVVALGTTYAGASSQPSASAFR